MSPGPEKDEHTFLVITLSDYDRDVIKTAIMAALDEMPELVYSVLDVERRGNAT